MASQEIIKLYKEITHPPNLIVSPHEASVNAPEKGELQCFPVYQEIAGEGSYHPRNLNSPTTHQVAPLGKLIYG